MSDVMVRLDAVLRRELPDDPARQEEVLQRFLVNHRARLADRIVTKLNNILDEVDTAEQLRLVNLLFDQLTEAKREREEAKKSKAGAGAK